MTALSCARAPISAFCTQLLVPTRKGHQQQSCSRRLFVVHSTALPPKRIASVAKDLQSALQASLRARKSRIDINLPRGSKLGTEKRPSDEDELSRRIAGDRELARILAGMFEGTGLSVHVVFPTLSAKKAAVKLWGPLVECSFDHWKDSENASKRLPRIKGKEKTKVKSTGFGNATTGKPVSHDDPDVNIIVGPTQGMLQRVRNVSESLGPDKLVILANANVGGQSTPIDVERYIYEVFEAVYHYAPNPHPKWSGGVLFRKFPDDWVLCRLSAIGILQKLLVSAEKPSVEQIGAVLGEEEQTTGNSFLKGISSFINPNRT